MRTLIQTLAIVIAALVLAVTANALASRTRKVMLVGWYPNATAVAPPDVGRASARPDGLKPVLHQATATVAPVPATVAPVPVPAAKKPPTPPTTTKPQPTTNTPDILAKFPQHPDKPYVEIGYDDVKALHDKGVLFLDARRTSVFEQGHIPGARPYSVWESDIDEKVRKLFDERSDAEAQARPIVVYCSGGDCEDSHMLAQKLWGIQFNNVYVYKDGFPDWQKRGGAAATGAAP